MRKKDIITYPEINHDNHFHIEDDKVKSENLEKLFDLMEEEPLQTKDALWPEQSDLDYIEKNIRKYYPFLVWVLTNAQEPITEEEVQSQKRINEIIKKNTSFE